MKMEGCKPKAPENIHTLPQAIEELWRTTRPKIDYLLRHESDPGRLQELNAQIGRAGDKVRELLEQSEGETSLEEQIQAYAEKRNLPLIAAKARIIPYLGKEERRKFEQQLQVYFSRLNIPKLMERNNSKEIDDTVKTLKVLRNEGYLDFIAIHSIYATHSGGTAVQKHIDAWRRERRKIMNSLPRKPKEQMILNRCQPEAKAYLEKLKAENQNQYMRALTLLTRTTFIGDAASEFAGECRREMQSEREGINCDELTSMNQVLSLASDTEIHDYFQVQGHVSLRINGFPLVFDVYDNRVRTIEEFAKKDGYDSRDPECRQSHYYRSSKEQTVATFDTNDNVVRYEPVKEHPYTIQPYTDIQSTLTAQSNYYQTVGDWKTAEKIYQFMLRFVPNSAQTYANLCRVAEKLGDYELAKTYGERSVQLDSLDIGGHLNLGVALERLGKPDEAERCYETAIKLNPNFDSAYRNLGVLLEHRNAFEEAEKADRKALALDPHDYLTHNNFGYLLMKKKGNPYEAEGHLREAIRLNPRYLLAYQNLTNLLKQRGFIQDAAEVCNRAVQTAPDHSGMRCDFALLLEQLGEYHRATEQYQRAIQINPNCDMAYNNLGNIMEDQAHDAQEAERLYQEALRVNPQNTDAHNNLALILMNVHQQFDEAERHLREALTIDQNYVLAFLNLGQLLYKAGRYQESRVALNDYLRKGGSKTHKILQQTDAELKTCGF